MAFQNLSLSGPFKHGGRRRQTGGFSIIGFCLIQLCAANSLCLAQSNQPVVKQISTQLRGFGVPFNINADASEFIEVQLYVTKDQGQSWQFYDRQQTDGEEFAFRAEADGEYWFALKTLDRDKKLLPDGETKPELKVIVDTVKPTLKFNIESDPAGRIVCSWVAQDEYIAPASLKILYRPEMLSPADAATGQGWKQVPIQLGANATDGIYRDRIAWWPEDNVRSYEVRLEIADSAGNTAFQESRVSVPLVAWRNRTQSTAHAGSWAANLFRKQQPAIEPPPQYMRNDFSTDNGVSQTSPAPPQQVTGNQRMVCEGGVCQPLPPATNLAAQLIGSEIEYVDPPVPEGMEAPAATSQTQQTSLTQTPYPAFSPKKSIPWLGKTEDPIGQQDLAVASTQDPYQIPDLSNWPGKRPGELPDELNIRPLPPINPADHVVKSTTELPGGLVVTESTATRKRSNQPMAEFRANAQPEWEGRGDAGLETSAQAGVPGQPRNPQARWQNQRFDPSVPQPPPTSYDGSSVSASQSSETKSTQPNQRVAFAMPERKNTPLGLSSPELDSLQQINSRRFNLNYSVDAIDPSGVDRVVLWMTRDGGQSWKSWATDPDSTSPFPVEVDESGVYGFRIVVHSRDGLTGLAPNRGDKPDMWVNVDTEAPLAQIISVPYGRGNEAGRLIINWQAEDPQLTLRPITLAYSANPAGPWTPIEQGLRNTGRYVWKVGSQVPERIYIRLEATDQAGNVGVFQLQNLIDISGLVPRGRIQSVEPIGN